MQKCSFHVTKAAYTNDDRYYAILEQPGSLRATKMHGWKIRVQVSTESRVSWWRSMKRNSDMLDGMRLTAVEYARHY